MKKILFICLAMLICKGSMASDNLIVSNVTIPKNGDVAVNVDFHFDEADGYAAFGFELEVPEGVSIVKDEDGYNLITLNETTCSGMFPSKSTDPTFGVYTMDKSIWIRGTGGTLMTFYLHTNSDLEVGTQLTVAVKNAYLSPRPTQENPMPESVRLSNFTFTVNIGEPDDGRIKFYENATTLPTYTAGEKGDVSIVRSIKANSWSTIVLPFTLTKAKAEAIFGSDVQLAEFTGFEVDYGDDEENVVPLGITINFSIYTMGAKKSMTGGKPFLIKTSMDITDFTADDVTLFDAITDVVKADEFETAGKFTGAFTKTVVPADGLFINNEKFYYSTGKTAIKAFRGWFELDAVLDKETDFGVKMFIDGFETKVEGVSVRDASGTIYDLSGRRVSRPHKSGVYIVNGKKAVLR